MFSEKNCIFDFSAQRAKLKVLSHRSKDKMWEDIRGTTDIKVLVCAQTFGLKQHFRLLEVKVNFFK